MRVAWKVFFLHQLNTWNIKTVTGNFVLYNVKINSANLKIFICTKEAVKVIFVGGPEVRHMLRQSFDMLYKPVIPVGVHQTL